MKNRFSLFLIVSLTVSSCLYAPEQQGGLFDLVFALIDVVNVPVETLLKLRSAPGFKTFLHQNKGALGQHARIPKLIITLALAYFSYKNEKVQNAMGKASEQTKRIFKKKAKKKSSQVKQQEEKVKKAKDMLKRRLRDWEKEQEKKKEKKK